MVGRPIQSDIRNHILELLAVKKKAYGYELYQWYQDLFGDVHIRSIYYHLKKGAQIGEIELHEIKEMKGVYSWGDKAERIYYTLGPKARPKVRAVVKKYFEKKG